MENLRKREEILGNVHNIARTFDVCLTLETYTGVNSNLFQS